MDFPPWIKKHFPAKQPASIESTATDPAPIPEKKEELYIEMKLNSISFGGFKEDGVIDADGNDIGNYKFTFVETIRNLNSHVPIHIIRIESFTSADRYKNYSPYPEPLKENTWSRILISPNDTATQQRTLYWNKNNIKLNETQKAFLSPTYIVFKVTYSKATEKEELLYWVIFRYKPDGTIEDIDGGYGDPLITMK